MQLSPDTITDHIGERVRVSALGGRGGRNRHHMAATLLDATKKRALVKPTGHGYAEWVPIHSVYSWKGGNQRD